MGVRRSWSMHFSIAKGGLRQRDWIGNSSSKDFNTISPTEVSRYVTFDTKVCNLLTLGPLILKQGLKGAPIGGFLSAQLAEIWATWREVHYLRGKGKTDAQRKVNGGICNWYCPKQNIPTPTPLPSVTLV